mmetsp:Transcript_7501/g.15257  ORF Transcript_7501/g.15257 Transcript_7501/m.15257 type:complete len:241 (+) Transcript_7501:452-1174(+)
MAHLPQQQPKRVDIASLVVLHLGEAYHWSFCARARHALLSVNDLPVIEHLGGCIARGSCFSGVVRRQMRAGAVTPTARAEVILDLPLSAVDAVAVLATQLGQAYVSNLGAVQHPVEQHVGRLDVPVDDAFLMQESQASGHIQCQLADMRRIAPSPAAPQEACEGPALCIFHHKGLAAIDDHRAVKGADARVSQARKHLHLILKALDTPCAARPTYQLHSHWHSRPPTMPHLTHPTLTNHN